jgi:exopolysaccharide biosynthesis polyprenyl glycosylphosphotransferase
MDVDGERLHAQSSQPMIAAPAARAPAHGRTQTHLRSAAGARVVMPVVSVEERLRKRQLRGFLVQSGMFVLDAAMINLAFLAAYFVRFNLLHGITFSSSRYSDLPRQSLETLQIAMTAGVLVVFLLRGLYRVRVAGTWFKQVSIVIASTSIAFALFAAYEFVLQRTDFALAQARVLVGVAWVTSIVAVCLARFALSLLLGWLYRHNIGMTNLLVVGAGRPGKLLMQHIADNPDLGYRVVGFIHDLEGPPVDFGRFKVLGTMAELDSVIRTNRVGEVIVALPSHQHQQILRTVRVCERAGADFKLLPDLYELSLSRIDVDSIEGVPLIGLRRTLTTGWQQAIKRTIDMVGAGLVLLLGAPIWLLVALAIKLDSPGPVLFRQVRVGYRGQTFHILKFRSMHVNADERYAAFLAQMRDHPTEKVFKDKRDPRHTRVGRFIRRTSLDEIPQFINVLKGEMSLVGPRPLQPFEHETFEDWGQAHVEVPPGVTGLWQVRGRSNITFDERILMDLYYIENWSLRLDLQILLRTIPAVLFSRGAF